MPINADNYRDYLLRWLDDDLSPAEQTEAEIYVLCHAEAADEWRRLQATKVMPKEAPVFPFKERLFRYEEEPAEAVVVSMVAAREPQQRKRGLYWAAAAIAAGLTLTISIWQTDIGTHQGEVAVLKKETTVKQPSKDGSVLENILLKTETGSSEPDNRRENAPDNVKYQPTETAVNKINVISGMQSASLHIEKTTTEKTLGKETPSVPVTNENSQVALVTKVDAQIAVVDPLSNVQKPTDVAGNLLLTVAIAENSDQPEETEAPETHKKLLVRAWANVRKTIQIKKHQEEEGTFLAISVQTERIRINKQFRTQ